MEAMSEFIVGHPVVSRETLKRLEIYQALLAEWNKRINLVSSATLAQFWTRHIADSVQLLEIADRSEGRWLDMGSGAGFPGLVLAMVGADYKTSFDFILLESDQRKSTFMRAVARETDTSVNILSSRIEETPPVNAHIISARALAPLPKLLDLAERHRAPTSLCIFPKGATADQEISDARKEWIFDARKHSSKTDPSATVLAIGEFRRG